MDKSKLVISIRYISLFLILINYSTYLDTLSIAMLLLFFINNQFRFFNLKKQKVLNYISIFLEIFIVIIIYKLSRHFTIFYFIPIIIDISSLSIDKLKYALIFIILSISVLLKTNNSIIFALENTSILLIIFLLSDYIYNQSLSKLNCQNLYDKLRISEDNLKKANKELKLYANSIEELTILKERNRISREIHDSVGHALSTTIIQLGALEKLLKNDEDLFELIHELKDFVNKSYSDVRDAVSRLKPTEYEKYQNLFKIEELVKNFEKLSNIDVKCTISKNTWPLSSLQFSSVYRIIQEALSNALKHGHASKIKVFITFNNDNCTISIKDNGLGCENIKKGNGLNGINERIEEINGDVKFINTSDGFLVQCNFPKYTRGDFIE